MRVATERDRFLDQEKQSVPKKSTKLCGKSFFLSGLLPALRVQALSRITVQGRFALITLPSLQEVHHPSVLDRERFYGVRTHAVFLCSFVGSIFRLWPMAFWIMRGCPWSEGSDCVEPDFERMMNEDWHSNARGINFYAFSDNIGRTLVWHYLYLWSVVSCKNSKTTFQRFFMLLHFYAVPRKRNPHK